MDKYEGCTPGPWKQNGLNGIHRPDGTCIAITYGPHNDVRQANAKLIADAPMLAERVMEVTKRLETANDILIILKPAHDKLAEQNEKMLAMLKRALPWMTDTLQQAKPDDKLIVTDIFTYLAEIEGDA